MVTESGLNDHKREIARLCAIGLSSSAVARRLGMSPALAARVIESEDVQEEVERILVENACALLESQKILGIDAVTAAVNLLYKVTIGEIDAPIELRVRCSTAILDREPSRRFAKGTKVEVTYNPANHFDVEKEAALGRRVFGMDLPPSAAFETLPEPEVPREPSETPLGFYAPDFDPS